MLTFQRMTATASIIHSAGTSTRQRGHAPTQFSNRCQHRIGGIGRIRSVFAFRLLRFVDAQCTCPAHDTPLSIPLGALQLHEWMVDAASVDVYFDRPLAGVEAARDFAVGGRGVTGSYRMSRSTSVVRTLIVTFQQ